MKQKAERLERGRIIYETARPYTGPNNRRYATEKCPAAYIETEQRFITNHDDTAVFVELIDADERVIRSWKMDCPLTKWFSDPDYYEDDCLILYLRETFSLPVIGWREPR